MQESEEIVLMNSACVERSGRICLLFGLYCRRNGRSFFNGTFARWDSPEGWQKGLEGLEKTEPARPFTFGMIGLSGGFSELSVVRGGSTLLVHQAKRMLRSLLGRQVSVDEFNARNEGLLDNTAFIVDFDGGGLEKIDDGEWHVAERHKGPRRKKRIIY